MSLGLSTLLKGLAASGVGKKVSDLFSKLKNGFSSGSVGASAAMGSVSSSSNYGPGFIKNWLHEGKLLGSGRILYLVRFAILIAFILGVLGVIGLTLGAESGQSIFTTIKGLFGKAAEGIEEGSQAYLAQYQLVTGQRYAAEVDTHADTKVGVNLAEVSTTQSTYQVNDPVTLWGIIDAKVLKSDKPIVVKIGCKNVKKSSEYGTKDVIEYGTALPFGLYTVYDTEAIDFKCEFQEGILSNDWYTSNNFYVTADFNFATMAYVTLNFMDDNAYKALENNDPERVAQLSVAPVSKNTYGPLEIGIGTNKNPVLVYNASTQAKSYLGISFTNKANGKIKNLTQFNLLIPKGVELVDCDSAISFEKLEPKDPEMVTYFDNFTLVPESLEYLSKKLNAENDYGQNSEYLAQSLRCFLEFKPEEIFEGKSRLDPVQLNVFAFADYDYQVEKLTTISVERDSSGTAVQVTPRTVGVNSEFECKAIKTTGNDFTSGTLTLKYRKKGDLESTIVTGYNAVPVSCPGDFCISKINVRDLPIASEIAIGDYLICQFSITRENKDEKTTATKLVKILNTPPVLQDVHFKFDTHPANQDLIAVAEISDEELDTLNPVQFKYRVGGKQIIVNGDCSEDSVTKITTCIGKLPESEFEEYNYVECSVYVFDGTDSNVDEKRISVVIDPETETVVSGDEVQCLETDDGKDYYKRGSVSGVTLQGEDVIGQDGCVSGSRLQEYYCDSDNYVQTILYDCECLDGACQS